MHPRSSMMYLSALCRIQVCCSSTQLLSPVSVCIDSHNFILYVLELDTSFSFLVHPWGSQSSVLDDTSIICIPYLRSFPMQEYNSVCTISLYPMPSYSLRQCFMPVAREVDVHYYFKQSYQSPTKKTRKQQIWACLNCLLVVIIVLSTCTYSSIVSQG